MVYRPIRSSRLTQGAATAQIVCNLAALHANQDSLCNWHSNCMYSARVHGPRARSLDFSSAVPREN